MKTKTNRQQNKPAKVPVDRNRWSESSQRTYTMMQFYEDIAWTCRGCGQPGVFTAQEQKQAFEVDHVYIHWRPRLCEACTQKKQSTAETMHRYAARWKANKPELQHDLAFLKQWIVLMETYAQLSGRKNANLIQMVQKLIQDSH